MSALEKVSGGDLCVVHRMWDNTADETARIIEHPATSLKKIIDQMKEENPERFAQAQQYISDVMDSPEVKEQASFLQWVNAFYENNERGAWRKENTPFDFVIANARNPDDNKRIANAKKFLIKQWILGHDEPRTPKMEKAFWEAHAYGWEKSPFTSAWFVWGKKLQILMDGGFSEEAAWWLTDAGYCVFGKFGKWMDKIISYNGQWMLNVSYFTAQWFAPEVMEHINNLLPRIGVDGLFVILTLVNVLTWLDEVVSGDTKISKKKWNYDLASIIPAFLWGGLVAVAKTGRFSDIEFINNMSNIPSYMALAIVLYSVVYMRVAKNATIEATEWRWFSK